MKFHGFPGNGNSGFQHALQLSLSLGSSCFSEVGGTEHIATQTLTSPAQRACPEEISWAKRVLPHSAATELKQIRVDTVLKEDRCQSFVVSCYHITSMGRSKKEKSKQ